jgi:hypothetical protein
MKLVMFHLRFTIYDLSAVARAGAFARIFHSEVGQNHTNHCSAGFQACVPWPFQPAFKHVCAYMLMGFSHPFPNHDISGFDGILGQPAAGVSPRPECKPML